MAEVDDIDDALVGQVRVVMTGAAQVAQQLYRAREWRGREGADVAQRERDRLTERFEAQRTAAHAQLRETERTEWWDQARPEQIGVAYQVARVWAMEDDPYARTSTQRIEAEVKTRYGVDVEDLADEQRHSQAKEAAAEHSAGTEDRVQADAALGGAQAATTDGQVNAAEAESDRRYDSAERRDADAAAMLAAGVDPVAVQASRLESTSHAEPARQAVQNPTAQRGRTAAGRQGSRERGLER